MTSVVDIFNIATGLLGVFFSAKVNHFLTETPWKRGVMERQLLELYAPLDFALQSNLPADPSCLVLLIREKISDCYPIVPITIAEECERLSSLPKLTKDDLTTTTAMISSFYNWTKKRLGYPYEKEKIKNYYTPPHEDNLKNSSVVGPFDRKYKNIFATILFAVWIFSFVALIEAFVLKAFAIPQFYPHLALGVFGCLALYGILFAIRLGIYLFKKRKKRNEANSCPSDEEKK